eukprot:scaffold474792_cov42-Prasinocladus_malaysianus.AAC.1
MATNRFGSHKTLHALEFTAKQIDRERSREMADELGLRVIHRCAAGLLSRSRRFEWKSLDGYWLGREPRDAVALASSGDYGRYSLF